MNISFDFSGKKVFITGGTRGIGKGIAEGFAKAGAVVGITGTSEEKAKQVADELSKKCNTQVVGFELDVSQEHEEIEKRLKEITKEFGDVDFLINNAGITKDNLFIRMSWKEWQDVININLTGTYLVTKAFIRGMMKKRNGRIINMSSIVGFYGNAGQVNYATSKSGLIGFTKSLAKEFGSRNITVNSLAPGYIPTAMNENIDKEVIEEVLKEIPLGRAGTLEEVAGTVMFLCSDLGGYINSETIHINGGWI